MSAPNLWPHQADALARLRCDLLSSAASVPSSAVMLQAPTGAGKTRLIIEIVLDAIAEGGRVMIVVPSIELVGQTLAAFETAGITDVGVIQGDHVRTDCTAPVQIASVQSLRRRGSYTYDILLIDEAHLWFAYYAGLIADAKVRGIPVIGLSATPWTKGLGNHYNELLTVTTTQVLIEDGYLSPFRVFAPAHPDLDGVSTMAGDFHEGQLAEAMNKDALVADVVSTWLRHGENRPTLCFGVDRAHAAHLQQQFTNAGVSAGYIDAFTDREDRAKLRHRFHTGETKVVCNVGCLTTGVDWDVRCIILARPTKSEMLFVQMIGRGLRTAPGKVDCLVLDHSDTHLRLGFVTDIYHDKLDCGSKAPSEKRERVDLPAECPSCHFLRPARVAECPACGFKPERQNKIEAKDGELVELGGSRTEVSIERKVEVFAQLRVIGKRRGYAPGWASNQFKQYFGAWPQDLPWMPDLEPTPELLGWVKSRLIAYAKGKERSNARAS